MTNCIDWNPQLELVHSGILKDPLNKGQPPNSGHLFLGTNDVF